MKNLLLHKLKCRFHRLGFYYYSVIFYFHNHFGTENIFKCIYKAIFDNMKIFNYKHGYYEYLEIPITTKCTLKCKHCSNLIPYYENPCDYPEGKLLKAIKSFLETINHIVFVRVLGGEPLLSGHLNKILKVLIKSDKISRIEVVTNGTIVPKDKELIKLLKDKHVAVSVSKYPFVKIDKLIKFLDENKIKYHIDDMKFWMDFGKPEKQNKTEKELIKQYAICSHVCRSLVNGQIHLCPRSSHGTDLGIIKDNREDYLDLLDNTMTPEERRKKLNELLKKKYIIACDYCDYGTSKTKKIPVAEQISHKK